MTTVFVSYSHTDAEVADDIVETLEELGIKYFRDIKHIAWGQSIQTTVHQSLRNAAAVIVVVSPGSLKSQWVPYEVGFATGAYRRVLPYLTHSALDLPSFMSDVKRVTSTEEVRQFFLANKDWHLPLVDSPNPKPEKATLNEFQVNYLMEISNPLNAGSISASIDNRAGREVIEYQEALEQFQKMNVMRRNGNFYKLTPAGWQLTDRLWQLAILDVLEVGQYKMEPDIAQSVGLNAGKRDTDELHRHIDELKQNGFARVQRTHCLNVALTQSGATHRKHRSIEV